MNGPQLPSVKKLPSFSRYFDAPPLLKKEPVSYKRRQRAVQAAAVYLNAMVGELDYILSSLPTPGKYDATTLGPPRAVSSTLLSSWFHARQRMPLARLASAVAVLEFLLVKYDLDVAAQEEPDESVVKRLNLAREHIERLTADVELDHWLTVYRDLIGRRLELDRKKSDADEALWLSYHDTIEERIAGTKPSPQ